MAQEIPSLAARGVAMSLTYTSVAMKGMPQTTLGDVRIQFARSS